MVLLRKQARAGKYRYQHLRTWLLRPLCTRFKICIFRIRHVLLAEISSVHREHAQREETQMAQKQAVFWGKG